MLLLLGFFSAFIEGSDVSSRAKQADAPLVKRLFSWKVSKPPATQYQSHLTTRKIRGSWGEEC